MKSTNLFKIDPLKNLLELPILWISVGTLFSLALIITIIILLNSHLEISLDYVGFNSFVEIFKVPLAILAIIITLIAFIATIHRSAQTREQIVISNKQNIFSNYYKHIEEFEKYMQGSISKGGINYRNLRLTHKYLFPNAFIGDYSSNREYLSIIEYEYSKFKNILLMFNGDEEKSLFQIFNEITTSIDNIYSLLDITISRTGFQIVENGVKVIISGSSVKGAIVELKNLSSTLIQILSFDNDILIPSSLELISNINTTVIPDIPRSIYVINKNIKFNVLENPSS